MYFPDPFSNLSQREFMEQTMRAYDSLPPTIEVVAGSVPDPWQSAPTPRYQQIWASNHVSQPPVQPQTQRLLPPTASSSRQVFPSDGPLRLGHEDVAVPSKGLFGTSFKWASNGQHVHPNSVMTDRMNKIGIGAAIGVPLIAGAAAVHSYLQSRPSDEDKANALLNRHLRG